MHGVHAKDRGIDPTHMQSRPSPCAGSNSSTTPQMVMTRQRTCSWPVCAGLVFDFGPMFLLRVAAAFLADALFSSNGFDAACKTFRCQPDALRTCFNTGSDRQT